MGERRYAGFTLRTECTSCGMPLPLDRPTRRATCAQCHNDVDVPDQVWVHVFEAFEGPERPAVGKMVSSVANVAGFSLKLQVANIPPRCEHCATEYPIGALPDDAAQDFSCINCGDPASVWPVPEWLGSKVATARQVVSTDPGGADSADGVALAAEVTEEPQPIAMPCPQCAGALRITAKHERIVPCQFCSTDIFLPDEVWRRLHPVKTVRWWFASFEGRTDVEAAQDALDALAAEHLAEKKQHAAAAFNVLPKVWIPTALFCAWQVVAAVLLISGSRGSDAVPIVLVSAGAYVVAVSFAVWPIAIAANGSVAKHAFWWSLGGLVAFGPPFAGGMFGLLAVAYAVGKRNPEKVDSGVGRPLAFIMVFTCLVVQVLFFTHAF